jgi:hypothetical protein
MSNILARAPSNLTWEELVRYLTVTNKDPFVHKMVEVLDRQIREEVAERVLEERDPDFEDMRHMWIMAGINLSVSIGELEKELLNQLRTASYENLESCVKALLEKFRHEEDPYSD